MNIVGSATRQKSDPGPRPDSSKPTAHIPPSTRVPDGGYSETNRGSSRSTNHQGDGEHVRGRPDGSSSSSHQRPAGWGIPRQQQQQPKAQTANPPSSHQPKQSTPPIYQPTHVKLPDRGEADGGAAAAADSISSRSGAPRPGRSSSGTVGGGVRRKPRHHARTQHHQPTVINVQCPLCARAFPKDRVELHAATCEGRVSPDEEVEVVEVTSSPPQHAASQQNKRMRNLQDTVTCPICNEAYSKTVIEDHAANCGDEVYV